MNQEWYIQLAEDVDNGHITEERADQLEAEYELAEYLAKCEESAKNAMQSE
jgi:hypothetical protein